MAQKKNISSTTLHFPAIFQAEPEGGFTVIIPSLPGCVTFGKNLNEAKKMAKEAIELYIEDMVEDGEIIPQYSTTYLGDVEVSLTNYAIATYN